MKNSSEPAPGSLVRNCVFVREQMENKFDRIEGESRVLPNLKFELSDVQLRAVKSALAKLEGAHRARVAWFGSYALEGRLLSIHALDLISVLDHCQRDPENEMELFRLRKSATEQLNSLRENSQNETKKQNIDMCLDSYKKLWVGADYSTDLTKAPQQPDRIELI